MQGEHCGIRTGRGARCAIRGRDAALSEAAVGRLHEQWRKVGQRIASTAGCIGGAEEARHRLVALGPAAAVVDAQHAAALLHQKNLSGLVAITDGLELATHARGPAFDRLGRRR